MKFWVKTYFCVLMLFLLVFNASICFIMSTTYRYMIDDEKSKARNEYYYISKDMKYSIDTLKNNNNLSDAALKNLIEYYSNNNISFLLSKSNGKVLSNLKYKMNKKYEEMLKIKSGQAVALVEKKGTRYILISSALGKYHLIYCNRLDRITDLWDRLRSMFIYFSLVVSFMLAIFLAIMLNSRSKPLKELIVSVNGVKNGNYDNRVKILGKDEFAILGENFNEMAEKIDYTLKKLNSDMQMKQKFIDNLSHELRTPLTSIYGYADYIQKAAISEEDKYEATEFIMKESKRLEYMANRLLDMTIRSQNSIVKGKIDVEELFSRVVKVTAFKAKKKSLKITSKNNLKYIFGEMELIESVIINLVDNAIKASEPGKAIEIAGISSEKESIIQITDNGKGIAEEHIDHILEPFYRADKSRSRAEGGTGLGLALCKQIMDMHKGKIEISSEVNKGTKISLIFTTS
ncbi:sensor histidine kinase [Clostridium oryzae]|uniref:histidine kinase n=1 Tax=Clostridium oryzae TaxID=1450648 RepID=A0A1V4INB4_9CLOT|nr:HAMP domain-containing sensor histidine kinase [Clostridium oryzae]OPJ61396.1 alkaline phosphatase synthesis sensor protein PhoR [Clostridium oryzae]